MNGEMDALTEKLVNYRDATKKYPVRPKSTDINIKVFDLAWIPVEMD